MSTYHFHGWDTAAVTDANGLTPCAWYDLGSSGAMKTGWVQWNGGWYYLAWDGAMLTSTTTPDGYRLGPDGAWIG